MKRFCLILWISVAACASAQTASVIGRARFVPDTPIPNSPILATRAYVASLPKMPAVTPLPQRLPPELTMNALEVKAWQTLREANRLMTEGQPEQASDLYRGYLEQHPDSLPVRLALADSLFARKAYRESETEYKAVLENTPLHFQALNNLAWMYCTSPLPEQQKPETALVLAARARTLLPNSHHVWSTLSMAHFRLGHYREALDHANTALQLAERSRAGTKTLITYLLHLDKCRLAVEATSILE